MQTFGVTSANWACPVFRSIEDHIFTNTTGKKTPSTLKCWVEYAELILISVFCNDLLSDLVRVCNLLPWRKQQQM